MTDHALGDNTGRLEVVRGTGGGTDVGLGNEACGLLGEGGKLDMAELFECIDDLDPLLL